MNDPLVAELATALGDRVIHEVHGGNDVERIRRLYRIALSRLPTDDEIEIGVQVLSDQSLANAWHSYCRLIVCTNEFLFVD